MRFLCLFAALQLALQAQSVVGVVPVEKFTQATQFSQARLSPDGRRIAVGIRKGTSDICYTTIDAFHQNCFEGVTRPGSEVIPHLGSKES